MNYSLIIGTLLMFHSYNHSICSELVFYFYLLHVSHFQILTFSHSFHQSHLHIIKSPHFLFLLLPAFPQLPNSLQPLPLLSPLISAFSPRKLFASLENSSGSLIKYSSYMSGFQISILFPIPTKIASLSNFGETSHGAWN